MDRMDRIIERSKQLRKEANLRLVKEAGGKGQAAKGGVLRFWRFLTGFGKNPEVKGNLSHEKVNNLLDQKGWASFGRGAAYTGAPAVGIPWLLSGGEYQPPTRDELSGGSGSGGDGTKGVNWLPWMLGVPAAGAAGVGLYKILNSKKPEPLPRIEDAVLSDAEIAAELRKRQEEQLQNEELYT